MRSPLSLPTVVLCLSSLALALPSAVWAEGITIANPPDRASPAVEKLMVVGTVDDPGVTSVNVTITGGSLDEDSPEIPVRYGGFSFKVKLSKGENIITVSAGSLGRTSVNLFRRGSAQDRAPSGFRPFALHSERLDNIDDCTACHEVSEKKTNYRRMTVGKGTCATSECHSDMGKEEFVHGPAAAGVCISCHNPHGSVNELYLSRDGADLCLVCHENKAEQMSMEFQHLPVARGDCSACHDPHGEDHKYQLKGDASDLCFQCHENNMTGQDFVHGPVASGDCNVCHDPHSSPYPRMLMASGDDLCFVCHEDRKQEFQRAHKHDPVEEDCSICHNPHAGPARFQLKSAMPDLCESCHAEVVKTSKDSAVKHPPAAEGKCASCHDPHTSDYVKLLKRGGAELCYGCHEEVAENIAESEFQHGPVRQGDCSACHLVHGAGNPFILSKYFPEEFYNSYSTEAYSLCFDCHNADMALDPKTKTLTDFRDDNKNLHYLHVNKPDNGRSCKACHEVHASSQEKHIRLEVPYGKMWSYPIEFTRSDTGGDCNVGCHKPLGYSRDK